MGYPTTLLNLIEQFQKFPSIGYKNAERLVLYALYELTEDEIEEFVKSLKDIKEKIKECKICGNLTEKEICEICEDNSRDKHIICIVHSAKDLISIEKTKIYNGLYHVLGGELSPIDGVSLEDLKIKDLLNRIKESDIEIKEIVLATNSDLEGETVAQYIISLIKPTGIKITQLAHGIAVGATLSYSDEQTISKALEGRIKL